MSRRGFRHRLRPRVKGAPRPPQEDKTGPPGAIILGARETTAHQVQSDGSWRALGPEQAREAHRLHKLKELAESAFKREDEHRHVPAAAGVDALVNPLDAKPHDGEGR